MIHGVGIDVVSCVRVMQTWRRFGDRFLNRAFHPVEIARVRDMESTLPAGHADAKIGRYLASRWAAKEATIKALGRWRLLFPAMSLSIDATHHACPLPLTMVFDDPAAGTVQAAGIRKVHVSVSHEDAVAVATATAERAD